VDGRTSYRNERRLAKTATLRLAARLIRAARTDEKLRTSRLWAWGLVAQIREWRLDRQERRFCEAHDELVGRYSGMLTQLLTHGVGMVNIQKAWPSFRAGLGMRMQMAIRQVEDPRLLSTLLWRETKRQIASQGGSVNELELLKPKFMLRQFLEEVKPKLASDVFRRVYETDSSIQPSREEAESFEQACDALHAVLVRHAIDLRLLADNALQFQDSITPAQYLAWLYPKL
jgi:hypothetical protein